MNGIHRSHRNYEHGRTVYWHVGCTGAGALTSAPACDGNRKRMKFTDLKNSGHWPTLLTAFLYFDFSFMVWTLLGPLGAQIGETLGLSAGQKGLMVAVPTLSGAVLRIVLGLAVDRFGSKQTGVVAQLIVMLGLLGGW